MRIVTISTIEPGSNSGGVALVQIIIDETGGRVINNGIDIENMKALMQYIGALGESLDETANQN